MASTWAAGHGERLAEFRVSSLDEEGGVRLASDTNVRWKQICFLADSAGVSRNIARPAMVRIRVKRPYEELIWGLIFGTLTFCGTLVHAGFSL
jgi:hypothetical protein